MVDNPDREYEHWQNWPGGLPCPVGYKVRITLRQRRGQEFDTETPHSWHGWEHDGSGSDIVAYRRWWPK